MRNEITDDQLREAAFIHFFKSLVDLFKQRFEIQVRNEKLSLTKEQIKKVKLHGEQMVLAMSHALAQNSKAFVADMNRVHEEAESEKLHP
jgi:hypothetical protein